MSYFEEQQQEWFDGGMFTYAEDEGVKIKVNDLDTDNEKDCEKAIKRLYKALELNYSLGEIPADYDPYSQSADRPYQ